MSCLARRLKGFSEDHRNDLAIVPDPVGGQRHYRRTCIAAIAEQLCRLDCIPDIAMGQNVQHTGHDAAVALVAVVDFGDAAACDGARHEKRIGRMGQRDVGGIARLAGNFEAAVDAQRWRADFRSRVHYQTLSWLACNSARTRVRLPSSGLKSLSPWVCAAAKAASAARRAPASSRLRPLRTVSAPRARQGLVATPPSAIRASATYRRLGREQPQPMPERIRRIADRGFSKKVTAGSKLPPAAGSRR